MDCLRYHSPSNTTYQPYENVNPYDLFAAFVALDIIIIIIYQFVLCFEQVIRLCAFILSDADQCLVCDLCKGIYFSYVTFLSWSYI